MLPTLDILIVNWNSGEQLRDCLRSFAAVSGDQVTVSRVIVVDNASSDGSSDGLTCPAPLKVIKNADNRGFAAACNQGAGAAKADFLLFLNPDTRLHPGSLERPAHYLQAAEHESVGIVGIQLVDRNDHVARNTARQPTPLSMIGNSVGLDRLLPSVFPPHFATEWAHNDTREVDQVMGAFFFVRRTTFQALGGFDERFFVYFEDMDFAVRARGRGWSTVYLADARAFHRGQGTTQSATAQRMQYFAHSRILYARKHFSAVGSFAVTFATLCLEPIIRIARFPGSAKATLSAFGALWRELPALIRN
jgi:GT2 family glycosyltransferase